jgi:uncharacterized protein (DUF302 family)
MTPESLITLQSKHGPKDTAARFVAAVEAQGMNVFARIDHAAAAHAIGLELGHTEVMIFGNSRAGSLLMQVAQTMGIDLPLRAVVWQDERHRTWLSYNDPDRLFEQHQRCGTRSGALAAMRDAVEQAAREAALAP